MSNGGGGTCGRRRISFGNGGAYFPRNRKTSSGACRELVAGSMWKIDDDKVGILLC